MSEQSMIERVARAICNYDAPSETYADDRVAVGMELGTVAMWTLYIPEARAAIEAMREPSPALVSTYLDANTEYWRRMDVGPAQEDKWSNGTPAEATAYSIQAMIDQALKESP